MVKITITIIKYTTIYGHILSKLLRLTLSMHKNFKFVTFKNQRKPKNEKRL